MPTFPRTSAWSKRFLSCLALPVLLAGCGSADGDPSEPVGTLDDQLVSENANDKIAFDFFVGKGLTEDQAAGIVGNLDQESGMDPSIWQYDGGPGRGIAQWSAGGRWDTDEHDNVVWYAGTKGASRYSLDLQLEFIWYELTTFGYGYEELRAAKSVDAAEAAFQDDYEICGECDASNRIAHAEAALADFGHAEGPPTPVPAKATGCGTIDEGHGLVAGESFESCSHRYRLAMQTDGNLVIYDSERGAIWATNTHGTDGHVAVMQGDGNFVLYGTHSDPLWASKTNGHDGAHLVMQDDGNLVVYLGNKPLWASGTNGK